MPTSPTIPPKRKKKGVRAPYTPDQVIAIIKSQKAAGESLRTIAAQYGKPITFGDIGRLLKDPPEFPASAEKIAALNMRPRVLAPACPTCNGSHPIKHPRNTNYQDLWAMPENVLSWKLENREEI